MAEENSKEPDPKEADPNAPDPNEGPGKGKQFFDRARTVGATGNFDYAIEMYLQGLNREPFNVTEHIALRNVAMHRKVSGAKSGGGLSGLLGGGPKAPFKGKTPKEGMLNAEFTLARDVGNITAMVTIVRNADILKLKEVVAWMGPLLKEANRTSKSPKIEIYTELAEIYGRYAEYTKSYDAIGEALKMKPDDGELASLLNQYAAQATMKEGRYDEEGDFKKGLKKADEAADLAQEERLDKSEDYLLRVLKQSKVDYEKNPTELQVISKYVKSLLDTEVEEHENSAIDVLKKAYVQTKIYRLKAQIGDVRIKQYNRNRRMLQDALKEDPSDKDIAQHLEELDNEQLQFEIGEFKERVEHMPTDMVMKYEYGRRLWLAKQYDEALAALQEGQQNPKVRVDSLYLLGRCFYELGMFPEAVDTIHHSVEEYDMASSGDRKSLDLHYWYARSLEANKQLKEACDIYSKIIRWNVSFMDARKRLSELRGKLDGGQ